MNGYKKIVPPIVLLLFTMLLYGFTQIKELGIYMDNWKYMKDFAFFENWSYHQYFKYFLEIYPTSLYRVSLIFTAPMVGFIGDKLNNIPLAVNLLSFIFNYIFILNTYYFIKYINPLDKEGGSMLVTFFITTYVGKSTTLYWGATHVQVIAFTLMLCASNTIFYSKNKYVKAFLLVLLSCLAVWSYETVIFIPITVYLSSLCKNYLDKKGGINIKRLLSDIRNYTYLGMSLFGAGLAVSFKLFFYSKVLGLVSPKVTQENTLLDNFNLKRYFFLLTNIYKSIGTPGLFFYYEKVLGISAVTVIFIASSLLIFAIIMLIKKRNVKLVKIDMLLEKNLALVLFGLLIFLGSVFVLSITSNYLTINPFSIDNRKLMLPSFGLAMILTGLILTIAIKSKVVSFILITTLTFLNISVLSTERSEYIKSWQHQTNVVKSIQDNIDFSDFQNKKILFVIINNDNSRYLGVPKIYGDWTIAHIMGYVTKNRDVWGVLVEKIEVVEEENSTVKNWGIKYGFNSIYVLDLDKYELYPLNTNQ